MTVYDDNILVNLGAKIDVELLPKQGICRSGFTYFLDGNRSRLYVMAGVKPKNECSKQCHYLDIKQRKWVKMPNLNKFYIGCTSFMSQDGKFLFCFGGFKDIRKLERLDLTDPKSDWKLFEITNP